MGKKMQKINKRTVSRMLVVVVSAPPSVMSMITDGSDIHGSLPCAYGLIIYPFKL
jgi:hypothetical protein